MVARRWKMFHQLSFVFSSKRGLRASLKVGHFNNIYFSEQEKIRVCSIDSIPEQE